MERGIEMSAKGFFPTFQDLYFVYVGVSLSAFGIIVNTISLLYSLCVYCSDELSKKLNYIY